MPDTEIVHRRLIGTSVGVVAAVVIGFAMLPVRSHLAIAMAGLVLVVPVVAGVAIGGWPAGFASVIASFTIYDIAYIPPYDTLVVGNAQNWVALPVYLVVMGVVARLGAHLFDARAATTSRAEAARHLLDLSELLLTESPAIAQRIVEAVQTSFDIEGVALLQPIGGALEVIASAGVPISGEELTRIQPAAGLPVALSTGAGASSGIQTLALVTSNHPIGLLALRSVPATRAVREALPILANHLAIALERSELQARAHRAELLEEIDRLRQALVGAVSHDLRTPLATIKVASSTLVDPSHEDLPAEDLMELFDLIDQQADRLNRLVNNLLDMTRIQSGAFEVRRTPSHVNELVEDAIFSLRSALGDREVRFDAPEALPLVDVDPLLVGEVLANLLDNAHRYAPPETPVIVEVAAPASGRLAIAVMDRGVGVLPEERAAVFETFVRFDTGGRSGLGLAIAKAFVEAHGDRIWVEGAPGGGARFVFTLPIANELNGIGSI